MHIYPHKTQQSPPDLFHCGARLNKYDSYLPPMWITRRFRNITCVNQLIKGINETSLLFKATPDLGNRWLVYLDLSRNRIRELNFAHFSKLSALRQLVLARNLISHVIAVDNSDAGHISWLDLSGNRLTNVSLESFGRLGLATLNISDNGLHTLSFGAGDELSELRVLVLNNNSMMAFDASLLDAIPSLEVVELKRNLVRTVMMSASVEWGTPSPSNIETLRLDHNEIRKMSLDVARFSRLRLLSLRNNSFAALNQSEFGTYISVIDADNAVKRLDLSYNKLDGTEWVCWSLFIDVTAAVDLGNNSNMYLDCIIMKCDKNRDSLIDFCQGYITYIVLYI